MTEEKKTLLYLDSVNDCFEKYRNDLYDKMQDVSRRLTCLHAYGDGLFEKNFELLSFLTNQYHAVSLFITDYQKSKNTLTPSPSGNEDRKEI